VRKLVAMSLLLFSTAVAAEDLFMVRTQVSFPEAMAVLQQTIRETDMQSILEQVRIAE